MLRHTATRAPRAPRNSTSIRSNSARSIARMSWSAFAATALSSASSRMIRSPCQSFSLTSDSVLVEDRHLAALSAGELIDGHAVHLEGPAARVHDDFVDFMGVAQGRQRRVGRGRFGNGRREQQAHPVAVVLPEDLELAVAR